MPSPKRLRQLARPAKIVSALHRREFEYRLNRLALTPADHLEDLGTSYGGWTIPTTGIDSSWTCYSIGAGADVSFDLELVRRFGARVRSIEPVAEYVELARAAGADDERFTVHQAALVDADGPIRMQRTHDRTSRSLSAGRLYEADDYVEVPGRTLPSLMRELGDDRIDLLKLDVEGFEYELMPQLDLRALGVRIFTIQVHHNGSVAAAKALLKRLEDAGYALIANRPNLKLSLVG